MNLFKKIIGSKPDREEKSSNFEEDCKAMARGEDEAARQDANSGLVALYPELGKRRRRKRGFTDIDFDEYVPELDDYEPGQDGEYLTEDPEARAAADRAMEERLAQVRARLREDLSPPAAEPGPAPKPAEVRAPAASLDYDDDLEDEEEEEDDDDRFAPEDLGADDADEDNDDRLRAEEPESLLQVPSPAIGRAGGRRAGRVKTRLLGFDHSSSTSVDPFEAARNSANAVAGRFPVGWIVVLDGPGRGSSFTLFNGVSPVGRGDDQAVKLDYGDNSISRSSHAMIAYDSEQQKFFLGHGGKANIVRLNGKPVLSTEELTTDDKIRIGETTLWFIALCGADFDWNKTDEANGADAAIA